eukprot:scaffold4697_cov277-Prasinococcus_capsulatus_cf.AAC.6
MVFFLGLNVASLFCSTRSRPLGVHTEGHFSVSRAQSHLRTTAEAGGGPYSGADSGQQGWQASPMSIGSMCVSSVLTRAGNLGSRSNRGAATRALPAAATIA